MLIRFVDTNQLTALLATKNIVVEKPSANSQGDPVILCKRYPHRPMSADECRATGLFIAKSFPFSNKALKLASCIIGSMAIYPSWQAVHIRIEGDLLHSALVRTVGLEAYTNQHLQQAINAISSVQNLSAVYIASGVSDEEFVHLIGIFTERFPDLIIKRKRDILKPYPELVEELDSMCLEEQALVDWLVCLGSPFFAGQHTSSFAYLAGYMRHYRGFDELSTNLFPPYEPCWDSWFPRV